MQLPIPDDWDGENFCEYAVCWPSSIKWRAILYGLLESPNQGRFWDFRTGDFLTLRAQFKPAYDYNFVLKECLMPCSDDVALAMQAIADSIAQLAAANAATGSLTNQILLNSSVCCEQTIINNGGGVVGGIPNPDGTNTPIYGTQPPLSVPFGEFPEGFEDLESYQADKCQVANLVVTGLVGTLNNIAAFGVFNGVALAGLIVASIATGLIFPPALIPIAAAAIGVLAVNVTVLAAAADEIEANRSAWVCAIYNSDSVEIATEALAELIDLVIAAIEVSGPVGLAVKSLVLVLLNGNTLNQAMQLTAHQLYAGADCSDCVGCSPLAVFSEIGTVTSDDHNANQRTIVIDSEAHTFPEREEFQVLDLRTTEGCTFRLVDFTVTSGWLGEYEQESGCADGHAYGYFAHGASGALYMCDQTINEVYRDDMTVIVFWSTGASPFTATFVVEETP